MSTLVQEILRVGAVDSSYRRKSAAGFDEAELASLNERCIHELIENEADQCPEGLALMCGDQRLTFRELNQKANQLAHFLIRFGVGPNTSVGICMHRTSDLVIGILGILKAGAAYVPIDPRWSTDRLAFTLEDSNVFVLLTQSALMQRLPRHNGPKLSLDGNREIIAKERKTNPRSRTTPKNLAYSIYTSAGFGEERGVKISHRGLLNYLSWGVEAFQLAKGSEPALDSTVSLDLAITRVLSLLMFGRTVTLSSRGT